MELRDSPFTVVVANDDDDGLRVRDLAEQWSTDGLLEEFAWVTPGDVERAAHGPPTVMATIIGRGEQKELMTLLGARPRSLIRVVLLHLLTHENSNAGRLVEACDDIAGLVSRAMPRQLPGRSNRSGMRLLRINLMVPESDLLPQDPALIERAWEINAVVSPEDRPDLDRMSVFVRRGVNLHGHGLAAAASVGGLWVDAAVGAFDSHETDSTTGGGEVVVIRCQARKIVKDDRSQELAVGVAETIQSSEIGAANLLAWGYPAENPDAVASKAAAKLLQQPEWAPLDRQPQVLEKSQVPLGDLVRNWALFQLLLPVAAVKHLFGLGQSVVERAITAATVGREAGEVGRVHPLTPDEARQVAEFRVKSLSDQLDPSRLQDEAASWGQTTPRTWRELRELCIGLVDGSRLPAWQSRVTRGGLDEVVPPSWVVPHPDATLSINGHEPLTGVDVAQVASVAVELEAVEADKAASANGEGSQPKGPPKEAKAAEPEGAGDEGIVEEESPQEELAGWVEARRASLLWQLAERIYDFRRRENGQAAAAHRALTQTEAPSTTRLQLAEKLVKVGWALTVAAMVFLALWIIDHLDRNPLDVVVSLPDLNWPNIVRFVLIVLLLLLITGTYYFQQLRAYEWRVLQRLHTIRVASDEYVVARQQERRWQLMYQGLMDWASVLAELLHRPWAVPELGDGDTGDYEQLPAAVAVAQPVEISAGPDPRVVVRGVEAICQRGWLAEEFHRIVALSQRNDQNSHTGDLPADLDLGLRPNGARAELVEVARHGQAKRAAADDLQRHTIESVRAGEIKMPAQQVVRLGTYSAGDPVVDTHFLGSSIDIELPLTPETFSDGAVVSAKNVPERIVLCLPAGLASQNRPNVDLHQCGLTAATRVDVSPVLQPSEVQLFAAHVNAAPLKVTAVEDFN